MGKIFCLMGKSSSGKDTIYQRLLGQQKIALRTIVPYTTRPIRAGETEGIEYHFCTEERLAQLEQEGRVIELRAYNTVYGVWKYFTVDDGQVDFAGQNYLVIGTLEAYQKLQSYYGNEAVLPIYIEVDDGVRLQRALEREQLEKEPKYAEMCRRFLADTEDFSEEKIRAAGIERRFINVHLSETIDEIVRYMQGDAQTK